MPGKKIFSLDDFAGIAAGGDCIGDSATAKHHLYSRFYTGLHLVMLHALIRYLLSGTVNHSKRRRTNTTAFPLKRSTGAVPS